jgi:hypothetical protein
LAVNVAVPAPHRVVVLGATVTLATNEPVTDSVTPAEVAGLPVMQAMLPPAVVMMTLTMSAFDGL